MEPQGGVGTQAVGRAVAILRLAANGPVSLSEIMIATGLARTTAFRIASALVAEGLLSSSGRSGFSIGPLVHELAAADAARHRGSAPRGG